MASIQKYRDGWRCQVCVDGMRDSQVFTSRSDARAWGAQREAALRLDKDRTPGEKFTLDDALTKYADEVSPKKRGKSWEIVRIEAMRNDSAGHRLPLKRMVGEITTTDLAIWRDHRLTKVSAGSVLREFTILGNVFEVARREWKWIDVNPARDVKRPPKPDHRDRLISWSEIRQILKVLGWRKGSCKSSKQAAARTFMLALRTGMRAGEICGLTWDRVKADHCELPVTKTKPRKVPLTKKSRALIDSMEGWDTKTVFGIAPQTLDATFRKARAAVGIEGFTFHDSRHTAATMIARRVDVLDLCKIFGWTNPKQAMVYYNPSVSDLARRLEK